MSIEIYWGSGSPYAWRVLLALEVKKAPYQSRLIEFSKNQHKTPEFLAINPRGKVPVLKDGDVVLSESLAILAYLDRKIPEPPLFGRSATETGLIWKAISESLHYFEPPVGRIIAPVLFNKVAEAAADIVAAKPALHGELRRLDDILARQDWLVGVGLSAADIAVYPFIEILLRAAGKDNAQPLDLGLLPLSKHYGAIARWCERILRLPGYDRTYPPHWRAAA